MTCGHYMNKYEVTLHTFCDACFNQRTCKGTCRRMQEMEKFISKYDTLARAYDKACNDLAIDTEYTKEQLKEMYLHEQK